MSSPQDQARRVSEIPSHMHSRMYTQPHGQDHVGHKRRRSGSDEAMAYAEQRPYEYSPSRKPEPQHMANRALHVLGNGGHNPASPYYHNGVERNGHTWHPDRSVQSHHSVHGSRPSNSEAQMIEVLQRDANMAEAQPRPWDHQPTTNGQANHDQYNHDAASGVTMATSKRKRNFSNRTKTGCMTCRTRKKKCDEAQPQCKFASICAAEILFCSQSNRATGNNCIRGGFPCKGYNMSRRVVPTKPAPVKAPVPLQSKDGQGDVSEPLTYPGPPTESQHSNRPPTHQEGGQARPIPIDDNDGQRQPPYRSSPPRNEPQSRPPHPGQQQWPSQQSQSSYTADHLPPLSDVNRSELPPGARPRAMSRPPTQGTPYPQHPPPPYQGQPPAPMQYPPQHTAPQPPEATATHPPSAPPPQQPAQWHQPPQPKYPAAYAPSSSSHSTTSGHARMSSSGFDHPKSNFKVSSQEDVEKSKMLRGVSYNHFDQTLVYERQRCERALDRYNAACKLDSGLSEQEVRNILIKVVDPSQDTTHKFPSQNHFKGHVGLGVKIEAPFTCTYGYNLRIQDDVYVGKGCTFDDAGKIEVGSRTIIGPGVTILTTDYSKDLVHRKGTKGFWFAHDVFIASGVIIGAKAVIYPGVKIDEGATIEPGAVVRESLKANQIHRASPAQILDALPR